MVKNIVMRLIKKNYQVIENFIFGGQVLPVYCISKTVPIYISYEFDLFQNAQKIAELTSMHEKPVFMIVLGYHCETDSRLAEIQNLFEKLTRFFKRFEMVCLCNTLKEKELLEGKGFRAVFCNQNAFLDEDRYPIMQKNKLYDAIYIARFTPCKRHPLAKKIPTLKLIGDYLPNEKEYFENSRKILSHASWTEKVSAQFIPAALAEAHVGLCLSDVEGAMYVSAEYLLCGIPVVSTPSLGGRDVFFDFRWVSIVDPDPDAIATAVESLKRRSIDPMLIRQATIAKFHEHRMRFVELVQEIYNERGISHDFLREWQGTFIHKFGIRTRAPFFHGGRFLRKK